MSDVNVAIADALTEVSVATDGGVAVVGLAEADLSLAVAESGQGPPGPPGPPGEGEGTASFPAGASVSGHRAVVLEADGRVRHADPADPADAHRIVGVSLNAAAEDDPVNVRRLGLVSDASLSFTPGAPVFVGAGGQLTQTVPAAPGSAFLVRVGAATAANALHVSIEPPILLN